MWDQLAHDLNAQKSLVSCTAFSLATRCKKGYSAVALHDGRIVSHRSLVPIVASGADAPSWATLTQGFDCQEAALPTASLFSFSNVWTAPEWRGQKINRSLWAPLADRYLTPGNVGISMMLGLASPMAARFGWQIVAWDRARFIGSLISLPAKEFPERATHVWQAPAGTRLYQGPHTELVASDPSVASYLYLWASDEALIEKLDAQICTCCQDDLYRWRLNIIDVYARPEVVWKVPFDSY